MKMFLLRTTSMTCQDCGMAAMVVIRADDEAEARSIAARSNSHGTAVTDVDWTKSEAATCVEFPLLDGPKGIVVGSWLEQHFPG